VTEGSISFSWGTSSGAGRYHLMVCTDASLTTGCINPDGGMTGIEPASGVTSASASLTAGTYYWAVRAIRAGDVGGWGAYSSTRTLTVALSGPPQSPVLASPAAGASLSAGLVSFSWNTSAGAGRYHLMVCTDSALSSGCINPDGGMVGVEPSSGVTSYSTSVTAGSYYWAVRAIAPGDVGGWGSYSAVRLLTVH
jgi:hypothetical protein